MGERGERQRREPMSGGLGGSDSSGGFLETVGSGPASREGSPHSNLQRAEGGSPSAEAVLKAEVLYKAEVMSRAEFASLSESSLIFQYEAAVKPEVCPVASTPPSEGGSKTGLPPQVDDLPRAEASRSEISLASDESSTLGETSMSEALPGLQEPSNLELSSMPEVEAKGTYFLGEEPFLQEEEPQLMPLKLLPGLHDPFAEVEAKLALLSSTVARADAAKVPVQVADVMEDARQKWSRQNSAGSTGGTGCAQVSHLCGASSDWWPWPVAGSGCRCSGGWERSFVSYSVNQ